MFNVSIGIKIDVKVIKVENLLYISRRATDDVDCWMMEFVKRKLFVKRKTSTH